MRENDGTHLTRTPRLCDFDAAHRKLFATDEDVRNSRAATSPKNATSGGGRGA
jgi:hypothetical protein